MKSEEATLCLLDYLHGAQLKQQDRLKPERELAAIIGCSRETLRHALDALERDGKIWRHQGKGTFFGHPGAEEPRSMDRIVAAASPEELLKARLVLEPALAAQAALSATPSDIEWLTKLAAATAAANDWQQYEKADREFHIAIARATHNSLLIGLFLTLSAVRGRARWQRQHVDVFRKGNKTRYAVTQGKMHSDIVMNIERRDGEAARLAMKKHLKSIYDLLE